MKKTFLLCALLGVLFTPAARAYVNYTDGSGVYVISWNPGTIPMEIKVPTTTNLTDGSSYASSVQAAMQAWNTVLGTVQFTSQIIATQINPSSGTYSTSQTDTHNEIVMDSTYGGKTFGTNTLAITTTFSVGDSLVQADMVFNTAWGWDSYRTTLSGHGRTIDIQRVAIHELGHVLGLNHPDQATPPQPQPAIMDSIVSDITTMQPDDIAGVQLLYGAPGFVPANDNFANATVINLSGSAAQLTGTNVGATRQAGEPNHVGAEAPNGHSVWWKWTASSAGSTTIDTLGSNFDTVLAVYTGSSVSALSLIASNDDAEPYVQGVTNPLRKRTSTVTFNAVGGTTYSIAVDGWGSVAESDQYTASGAITLNLTFGGTAPVFTTQPASQSVAAGSSVTFTAAASGTPAPTYQWQKAGVNISGATGSSYTISSVAAGDAGNYSVVATNSAGSVSSATAGLIVMVPPSNAIISITVQ